MPLSFFDPADIALYPEIAVSILGCYLAAITLDLIVVGAIAYKWKKLPYTFRITAATSTALILIGFCLCLFYLTTLHTLDECTVGRKVHPCLTQIIYFLFYAGFVTFDIVNFRVTNLVPMLQDFRSRPQDEIPSTCRTTSKDRVIHVRDERRGRRPPHPDESVHRRLRSGDMFEQIRGDNNLSRSRIQCIF